MSGIYHSPFKMRTPLQWLVDKKILSGISGTDILKMLAEKHRLELLSDPLLVKSGLFNDKIIFEWILNTLNENNKIAWLTTPWVTEKLKKSNVLDDEMWVKIDKAKIRSFLSQLAQDDGYDYKTRYKDFINSDATLKKNIINILRKPISSYSPALFFQKAIKNTKHYLIPH